MGDSNMATISATAARGTIRFVFPIPGKPEVTMFLPADLEPEDWEMVTAIMAAYIKRREIGDAPCPSTP